MRKVAGTVAKQVIILRKAGYEYDCGASLEPDKLWNATVLVVDASLRFVHSVKLYPDSLSGVILSKPLPISFRSAAFVDYSLCIGKMLSSRLFT